MIVLENACSREDVAQGRKADAAGEKIFLTLQARWDCVQLSAEILILYIIKEAQSMGNQARPSYSLTAKWQKVEDAKQLSG